MLQYKSSLLRRNLYDLSWVKCVQDLVLIVEVYLILLLVRVSSETELFPQEVKSLIWRQWLNFFEQYLLIELFCLALSRNSLLIKHGKLFLCIVGCHWVLQCLNVRLIEERPRFTDEELFNFVVDLLALSFEVVQSHHLLLVIHLLFLEKPDGFLPIFS